MNNDIYSLDTEDKVELNLMGLSSGTQTHVLQWKISGPVTFWPADWTRSLIRGVVRIHC